MIDSAIPRDPGSRLLWGACDAGRAECAANQTDQIWSSGAWMEIMRSTKHALVFCEIGLPVSYKLCSYQTKRGKLMHKLRCMSTLLQYGVCMRYKNMNFFILKWYYLRNYVSITITQDLVWDEGRHCTSQHTIIEHLPWEVTKLGSYMWGYHNIYVYNVRITPLQYIC